MFFLSVFLFFLLWLAPLLVTQKIMRFVLVFLDRTLSKSLVDTPLETERLYVVRRKEYGLIAWGLTLSLFLFIITHLPKPPEIEEDNRKTVILRLYSRGMDVLRMRYADTLLQDAPFDASVVARVCAEVPSAAFENHTFTLQCSFQDSTTIAINVIDAGKVVFPGVWGLP
jgi:hypothetical protein